MASRAYFLLFLPLSILASRNCPDLSVTLPVGTCNITGTSISSYGVQITVAGTALCVAPSGFLNDTLLESSESCSAEARERVSHMSEAACKSRRGNTLDLEAMNQTQVKDVGDEFDKRNPGWVSIVEAAADPDPDPIIAQAVDEELVLMGTKKLNFQMGIINPLTDQHTNSHLGLASDSTLLKELKDQGLVNRLAYGLDVGRSDGSLGNLVLGGHDAAAGIGDELVYDITNDFTNKKRTCSLKVRVLSISLAFPRRGEEDGWVVNVADGGNDLQACVEPYDHHFRFSSTYLSDVRDSGFDMWMDCNQSLALDNDQVTKTGLLNIEPGLIYQLPDGQDDWSRYDDDGIVMTVVLQNDAGKTLTVNITQEDLFRPFKGLDNNGTQQVNTSLREVQVYHEDAIDDSAVLGRAFLSKLNLRVDFESQQFGLRLRNPNPAAGLDIVAVCKKEGLSSVGIGLIAVGSVLAVLLVFLAWLGHRGYMKRRARATGLASGRGRENDDGASGQNNKGTDIGTLSRWRTKMLGRSGTRAREPVIRASHGPGTNTSLTEANRVDAFGESHVGRCVEIDSEVLPAMGRQDREGVAPGTHDDLGTVGMGQDRNRNRAELTGSRSLSLELDSEPSEVSQRTTSPSSMNPLLFAATVRTG